MSSVRALETYGRYVLAAPLAQDKRVLDLGARDLVGLNVLSESGAKSFTAATEHFTKKELKGTKAKWLETTSFPLACDDDAFDLIITHNLSERLEESPEWLEELRRILSADGLLVAVAADPEGEFFSDFVGERPVTPLGYEDLYEALSETFGNAAVFGQSPVVASLLFDFESEAEEPGLTFDGTLLESDGEAPGWYVLIFGDKPPHRDDLLLVRHDFTRALEQISTQESHVGLPAVTDDRLSELEKELATAKKALSATRRDDGEVERLKKQLEEAEEQGSLLAGLRAELETAKKTLQAQSGLEDDLAEAKKLEARLGEVDAELKKTQKNFEAAKKALSAAKEQLADHKQTKQELQEVQARLVELQELPEQLKAIKEDQKTMQQVLAAAEELREESERQFAILQDEHLQTMSAQEEQLAELTKSSQERDEALQALTQERTELESTRVHYQAVVGQLAQAHQERDGLRIALEEAKAIDIERQRLAAQLGHMESALIEVEHDLAFATTRAINQADRADYLQSQLSAAEVEGRLTDELQTGLIFAQQQASVAQEQAEEAFTQRQAAMTALAQVEQDRRALWLKCLEGEEQIAVLHTSLDAGSKELGLARTQAEAQANEFNERLQQALDDLAETETSRQAAEDNIVRLRERLQEQGEENGKSQNRIAELEAALTAAEGLFAQNQEKIAEIERNAAERVQETESLSEELLKEAATAAAAKLTEAERSGAEALTELRQRLEDVECEAKEQDTKRSDEIKSLQERLTEADKTRVDLEEQTTNLKAELAALKEQNAQQIQNAQEQQLALKTELEAAHAQALKNSSDKAERERAEEVEIAKNAVRQELEQSMGEQIATAKEQARLEAEQTLGEQVSLAVTQARQEAEQAKQEAEKGHNEQLNQVVAQAKIEAEQAANKLAQQAAEQARAEAEQAFNERLEAAQGEAKAMIDEAKQAAIAAAQAESLELAQQVGAITAERDEALRTCEELRVQLAQPQPTEAVEQPASHDTQEIRLDRGAAATAQISVLQEDLDQALKQIAALTQERDVLNRAQPAAQSVMAPTSGSAETRQGDGERPSTAEDPVAPTQATPAPQATPGVADTPVPARPVTRRSTDAVGREIEASLEELEDLLTGKG